MTIVWSPYALVDLQQVEQYISESSPWAASRISEHILAAIQSLKKFPALGRPGRVANTRELIVTSTPYIIPYRIEKNCIIILAIMHGSRA